MHYKQLHWQGTDYFMSSNPTRIRLIHQTPLPKSSHPPPSELSPKTSVRDTSQQTHNRQIIFSKTSIKVISLSPASKTGIGMKQQIKSELIFPNHKYVNGCRNNEMNEQRKNVNIVNNLNGQYCGNSIDSYTNEKLKKEKKEQESQEVYKAQKGCYRGHNNCKGLGVPYRKCLSTMEEKIVSIINKIKSGKPCWREIETLLERVKKVSTKELSNRYFVSGLHTIHKLLESKPNQFEVELCSKFQAVLSELKHRIIEQLDSIRYFSAGKISQETNKQNKHLDKNVLIRRAYRIFRKKAAKVEKEELQRKAVEVSQKCIEHEPNKLEIFWMEVSRA